MGMDALVPFAVIVGLTLMVFLITNVVEGYEAPTSAADSLKRILASTGGWIGGFLIASLVLNGRQTFDDNWPSIFGALTAIAVIFLVDMIVLYRNSRRMSDGSE
jgi:hypothetical protein